MIYFVEVPTQDGRMKPIYTKTVTVKVEFPEADEVADDLFIRTAIRHVKNVKLNSTFYISSVMQTHGAKL